MNATEIKDFLEDLPLPTALVGLTAVFLLLALGVNRYLNEGFAFLIYAIVSAFLRLFYKGIVTLLKESNANTSSVLKRQKVYHAIYYILQLSLPIVIWLVYINK